MLAPLHHARALEPRMDGSRMKVIRTHYHSELRGRGWRVKLASRLAHLAYRAAVVLRVSGTATFEVHVDRPPAATPDD